MNISEFIRFDNLVLLPALLAVLKKFYDAALRYQTYHFKEYFLVPTRFERWLMHVGLLGMCFCICFSFTAKSILVLREYMWFIQFICVCALNVAVISCSVMPPLRAGKSEFKIIYSRNILRGKYYNKNGGLFF
jgi:hypothetical protein